MRDYKQGKIYTIRCKYDDSLIYVGSTVERLCVRMARHRASSKQDRCINFPLYQEVNKTNWDDWFVELYEDCPCESKEQLNKKEGQIIREIGTLNKKIAGRTTKEFYRENFQQMQQYHKQYRQDNFDKLREQKKQWRRENADRLNENNKQYYIDNIAKIQEYQKQYRIDNSDELKLYKQINAAKLNAYLAQKITCECGEVIARSGNARHKRTNKHIEKMKKND
jgi:hypothetical protein